MEEYVSATLNRKNLKRNLHHNLSLKKDCDARNNARKACIYGRSKTRNNLKFLEDLAKNNTHGSKSHENYEDSLINELDEKIAEEIELSKIFKINPNNGSDK